MINRQDESNPQSSVALKHDSHLKALCTATAYLTIQSTFPCTKANTYSAWMHSSLQSITKTYKLSYTWLRLDKNNIEYNKLKINTGELLFLFCLQVGVWTQSLARPCYSETQVIQSWYQYISETLVLLRFFKFLTQAQWKVVFEPALSGVRHSRVLNKSLYPQWLRCQFTFPPRETTLVCFP